MRLAHWRIGYRLGAGFAILIVMLFVMSVLSLSKLSDFQGQARGIVMDVYPKTVDVNALIDTVNDTLIAYQRLLLIAGEEQVDASIAAIGEQSKDISRQYSALEANIRDAKSVNKLREIQTIRAEYLTSGERLFSLMKAGDRDGAIQEFNARLNGIQERYSSALKQLVDYQDDQMTVAVDVMADAYADTRMILLIILAVGALLGALIAWSITRSVTHPIQQALVIAGKVAQGDLTTTQVVAGKDETGMLLQALEHMNASLRQIVGQVRDGAETISTAASQIAAGNQDLSARTEEQASSLEETASSMEQLTSTIKNTADNTHQATEIANKASDAAQRSGEVMLSVTQKMRGIRDSSQRMAEIIGVIDGIAFQTNILALNAAVEAARAGEQGRGFAVVAGEVRSLAQRSATAAKEIKELIDDSVGKISEGMQLVDAAEEKMGGLSAHVRDVSDIIGEISQASREQSDGINQINLAVGQIDTTTQQNAALVEESASAALSLQSQASMLAEAVSVFRLYENGHEPTGTVFASAPAGVTARVPTLPAAKRTGAAKDADGEEWTAF